jgi:hypothetical protein
VTKFKYLRTAVTNETCIHEEIKYSLNSGNACYHAVQSLLSSCLLPRKFKMKLRFGETRTEGICQEGAEENVWA